MQILTGMGVLLKTVGNLKQMKKCVAVSKQLYKSDVAVVGVCVGIIYFHAFGN